MIRIEWKENTDSFAEYKNLDEFYASVKTWHLSNLQFKSAMEIVLEYYNLYIDGIQYEA